MGDEFLNLRKLPGIFSFEKDAKQLLPSAVDYIFRLAVIFFFFSQLENV